MKKIGIVTFHRAHNYGAMLQACALVKKLKKISDSDVNLINYYNPKIYNQYKVIRPLSKNLIKSVGRLTDDIVNYKKKKERFDNFEKFIKTNCEITEKYCMKDFDEEKNTNLFDILITGSDQVWNPKITGGLSNIYTLNFGGDDKKRISYAASIGDTGIIENYKHDFSNKLSKLDYISVREEDAKNELSKIIDKKIEVVLDPTLLLTRDEWNNELKNCNRCDDKYILAYVVAPDEEYIKIVNDLSEKTGLPIIHFGIKNPGYKNVLKSAYTEGPLEFVGYIKNAEYVVATSFHATVFSIIFNRKFFIIPHRKTGARVTNLLDKLKIEGRTFSNYEEFKNIDYDFETDWTIVESQLEIERKKSLVWLKNAIEG